MSEASERTAVKMSMMSFIVVWRLNLRGDVRLFWQVSEVL